MISILYRWNKKRDEINHLKSQSYSKIFYFYGRWISGYANRMSYHLMWSPVVQDSWISLHSLQPTKPPMAMAVHTAAAFSPPPSVSQLKLSRSSFSLIPFIYTRPQTYPKSLPLRLRLTQCAKKEVEATAAAAAGDPKLGVAVYKPRSYDALASDAANSLFYALNDGKTRVEIEFP